MKTTRKILPALVMLLVSAIMLSTASYAWFASNSKVTVNNMHVQVKANTKFLEISETVNGGYSPAVTYTGEGGSGDPEAAKIELIHADFNEGEKAYAGVTDEILWRLGTSSLRNEIGDTETTPIQGQDDYDPDTFDITRYALYKTVYVRLSDSSDTNMANLTIDTTVGGGTNITTASTDTSKAMMPSLRILVVAEQYDAGTSTGTFKGAQIYDPGNGLDEGDPKYEAKSLASYGDTGCLVDTVLREHTYRLSIYIYFDGADAVSMTDNAGDLSDYRIDVAFKAT